MPDWYDMRNTYWKQIHFPKIRLPGVKIIRIHSGSISQPPRAGLHSVGSVGIAAGWVSWFCIGLHWFCIDLHWSGLVSIGCIG